LDGTHWPATTSAPTAPPPGTINKNTNALLRQYLPKKTEFTTLTQQQLNRILGKRDNMPPKSAESGLQGKLSMKLDLQFSVESAP